MGQFNKPLFNIDQAGLQFEVNSYIAGILFFWRVLFPLKYTSKFELKGFEGNDGIPVSADRVAFNAKTPLKSRKKVGTWNGELGKIAIERDKNELEINEYNDALAIANARPEDKALATELVNLVYDDVRFCNDGMDAKIELDSMRIACLGKQTYSQVMDGDNVTADEIDFNIPADNKNGAKTAWASYSNGVWTANASADGLKDIVEASRDLQKRGKKKPQFVYMEQTAFDWLTSQTATAKKLYPTASAGVVTSDMISLDSVNAYLRGKSAPQIRVVNTNVTIQDKDGTEHTEKPWQEHLIVMSPTENLGYTYYKPVPVIPNVDAVQVQGSYYKMTRFSELNPMVEKTMCEAYVQPVLTNRASLCFINVAKTSWADGAKE